MSKRNSRALKERNDALELAAKLRENFVHHVSYQLRSPLTNVIGFTEGKKGKDKELEDLRKALWYLQHHIETLEK